MDWVSYDNRSQEFTRTVVLACCVEYSEEGLFAINEAFFDVCVFDSWEPLDRELVFDESDLWEAGRGRVKDPRWETIMQPNTRAGWGSGCG